VAVAVNRDEEGRPTTSVCAILQVDQPERFAGPGAPPIEGAPFPTIAARPSEPVPATVPGWLWAGAGVLLAVLLIAVWQRRDRAPESPPEEEGELGNDEEGDDGEGEADDDPPAGTAG
jgi:hypothetical protein